MGARLLLLQTRILGHELTRINTRGFEDLCTTRSKEQMMLTTTPTSTFQSIVQMNVIATRPRSVQARILRRRRLSIASKESCEGNLLPEVKQILGYFRNQIEDDEGNSVCVY